MNAQFHTPSFGDEVVFDLADDSNAVNQQHPPQQQQQHMHSKRMRSLDQSLEEYHTANDESFETAAQINNTSPNTSTYISTTPTTGTTTTTTLAARKQLATPNEPAKPLSPYALFFRDTVSAIKQQNPKCSFQDLSVVVASMWEALDATHKNVYNKKNEIARNEYIKQMHLYRQQQQQQHEREQDEMFGSSTIANDVNGATLQTKPAVFTITRCGTNSTETFLNTNSNNFTNQMMTSPTGPQQQQQSATFTSPSSQQQHQFNTTPQPLHDQQKQPNNNSINSAPPSSSPTQNTTTTTNNISTTPSTDSTITTDPSQQQIQMLTEAGSVQKCTRDNCNKRAIINPDWEDEYCSNECVVIHCRNVFNAWVQSNLESRKQ